MKTWKYGVSCAPEAPKTAPIPLTGDLCDCLRKAAALGFDAIDYHTRENVVYDYDLIRRTMEETGCRISAVVTGRLCTEGGFTLTSEDPENEKTAVEGILKYIDMAANLGNPHPGLIIGWVKGKISAASSREAYFARLAKNLKILDAAAAEKKVPLYIEILNRYEIDCFLTAKETVAFLEEHELNNCLIHLDTFHMGLEEEDHPAAIRTVGSRLGYFHIADTTRWYPGSGYLDFKAILQALDEVGYQGYLTLECLPHEDGEETCRKGLAYTKCIEDIIH